jgi:arginyl-tRNA synthetase
MEDKIKNLIQEALKNLGIESVDFVVEHPADLKMGDYSTNVAMALSKKLGQNPKEIAEKIVETLRQAQGEFQIAEIQVAGAGFINFYLSKEFFTGSIKDSLSGKI